MNNTMNTAINEMHYALISTDMVFTLVYVITCAS